MFLFFSEKKLLSATVPYGGDVVVESRRFGRYPCPSSCSIRPRFPTQRRNRTPHSERHVTLLASCCGRSDWPSRPCPTRKRCVVLFFLFVFFGVSARRCGETEWLGFQLHYKLNNPPKHKPFTVREPHSSPGT